MWPQVLDHFECLLRQQPDQWTFYVNYFEALFHLCDSGDGDMKATVDRAVSLLDCLQSELSGAKERIRGPYLARLYLWQQLHERQVDAAALLQSEGRALLESYVSLLGDKPCAFQDLRLFARSLLKDGDEQEVDLFLKFCSAEAGGDGDVSAVSTVKQLCRHLLHAQLTFFLGGHTSDGGGDKVQKAAQFWSQYLATKSLNSGLLATDFRPNDLNGSSPLARRMEGKRRRGGQCTAGQVPFASRDGFARVASQLPLEAIGNARVHGGGSRPSRSAALRDARRQVHPVGLARSFALPAAHCTRSPVSRFAFALGYPPLLHVARKRSMPRFIIN